MVMTMLMAFTFTSCGDDDEDTQYLYTYGITSVSSNSLTGYAADDAQIRNAFETALKASFSLSGGSFIASGNLSDINAKIKAACQSAESSLSSYSFSGTYVYTVNRYNIGDNSNVAEVIYTHTFK
jgi:hypothetical protein